MYYVVTEVFYQIRPKSKKVGHGNFIICEEAWFEKNKAQKQNVNTIHEEAKM